MLKHYQVKIDPEAFIDIQEGIEYYDEQLSGLGEKFENSVDKHIIALGKNPFYQIRFSDVRCFPIKKYPYIILFKVYEAEHLVRVISVFQTSQDQELLKRMK
jgi:hypothetical protein